MNISYLRTSGLSSAFDVQAIREAAHGRDGNSLVVKSELLEPALLAGCYGKLSNQALVILHAAKDAQQQVSHFINPLLPQDKAVIDAMRDKMLVVVAGEENAREWQCTFGDKIAVTSESLAASTVETMLNSLGYSRDAALPLRGGNKRRLPELIS